MTGGARPGPSAAARAAALDAINGGGGLRLGWLWEWVKVFQVAVLLFLFVRAFLVEAYKIPSGSMEGTLLVGDFLLVNKLVYGAEVPFTGKHLPRLEAPARGDVVVFQWPADPSKNFVKRLVGLPGDTLAMRDGVLAVNGVPQRERYARHTEPGADPAFEDFRWQRDYAVSGAASGGGAAPAPATPAGAPGVLRTALATPTDPRADVGAPGAGPVAPTGATIPAPASVADRARREPGERPSRNNWGPLVVPRGHYFVLGDNRDNSLDSRYWGFVPDSLLRGRPLVVYYSYAPDSASRLAWLTAVRWSRLGEVVR